MLQPYQPISTSPEYITWEDELTHQIELALEVDRSDAQSIVMVQQAALSKAWTAGFQPKAAAELVIVAATGNGGPA